MTSDLTETAPGAQPDLDKGPACRVYAIQARDGRSAVVFRRGPSRQILVLRWWFADDRLERGQWLKGRIYERRCDLSPNGDLLIYFAAKWETPLSTWTAVSRTPFLTALAIWPKGDAWGGGGLFEGATRIALNHRDIPEQAPPRHIQSADSGTQDEPAGWHPLNANASGKKGSPPRVVAKTLPNRFTVQLAGTWAGHGEDNPIEGVRMARDGWRLVQQGKAGDYGTTKGFSWKLETPEIMERAAPHDGKRMSASVLQRELRGIGQRDGPWYVEDFIVRDATGRELRRIAGCSWADWHVHGDLLFAVASKLYRLARARTTDLVTDPLDGAVVVADLDSLRFVASPPPDWALRWP